MLYSLRLWPFYVIGLLLLAAFLTMPMPLAGQTTTAQHLESETTHSSVYLVSGQNSTSASVRTTTTTLNLHELPGHLCDRCPETDNLPPWRRRIAERIAAGRPTSLGVEQQP